MIRFFITTLILIIGINLYSQDCPCSSKKARKLAIKAQEELYRFGSNIKYVKALSRQAMELDPQCALPYYILSEVHLNAYNLATQRPAAGNMAVTEFKYYLRFLKKAVDVCFELDNYKAADRLSYYFYKERMYKEAIPYLKRLAESEDVDLHTRKNAARRFEACKEYFYLINTSVPFNPNAVEGVCTDKKEYLPFLTADQRNFYFTRGYTVKRKDMSAAQHFEEFTVSDNIGENGLTFDGGTPMPAPFNMPGSDKEVREGGVCMSIDNKHMFVTKCQLIPCPQCFEHAKFGDSKFYWNCDIFYTRNVDGEWQELERLPEQINDKFTWESQPSVSSDGKVLYYSSNRHDDTHHNYGYIDIFRVEKDESGEWGTPVNLGPNINTEFDEKSPFIHPDNKTLYFSSNKPGGLGGYDIFHTEDLGDNEWKFPINIGKPINSAYDDLGFFVSTDGSTGYFTSDKLDGGSGGLDIFGFDLYEEAQPKNKVVLLKGVLTDKDGNIITNAEVEIKDPNTNKITKAMVDSVTGEYAIAVSVKKDAPKMTNRYLEAKNKKIDIANLDGDFKFRSIEKPKRVGQTVLSPSSEVNSVDSSNIEMKSAPTDTLSENILNKEVVEIINDEKIEIDTLINSTPKEELSVKPDDLILKVKKKGYAYSSMLINPYDTTFKKPSNIDMEMNEIEVGQAYRLNNINFATNSSNLFAESYAILNDFIEFLVDNPNLKIGIYGHTDNVGDKNTNMILSENRAKTVHDYLLEKNVNPERLEYKGYGESMPVLPNDTPEGRAENRRTEFVVLEK